MRLAVLAFGFVLFASASGAETHTYTGRALPAAFGDSYWQVAGVAFENYSEMEDKQFAFFYRRFLMNPVQDDDKPYRLQPFYQHASYLGGRLVPDDVGDSTLLAVEGKYFIEQVRLSAGGQLGFGKSFDDHKRGLAGGEVTYYFTDAYDFALEIDFTSETDEQEVGGGPNRRIEDIVTTTIDIGVRYVMPMKDLALLELAGGYRNVDVDGVVSEGIVVDGRYYFNKQIFAGVGITTEPDRFSVSGGYSTLENFYAELEIGDDDALGGQFGRIEIGLRF